MITKIDLRKKKNWLKAFSLSTLLMFATSCSDSEEDLNVIDSSVTSSKVNTTFQAEDYDDEKGIQVVGGWKVGYVDDEDYIVFEDFDHSGASSITVSASSATSGGTIQFRKGSATGGNLLAEVNVPNTGGWNTMKSYTANITGSSSNSDLYIVFIGGSGALLDLDNFKFNSSGTTTTSTGGRFANMVGKTVRLENTQTNDWFRITSTAFEANCEMVDQSNTGDWPKWIVEEVSANGKYYYRFKNKSANKRFRPSTSGNDKNINLGQTSWVGNWTQWEIESKGNGEYVLKNRSTGTYLSAVSSTNGTIAKSVTNENSYTTWRIEDESGDDANGQGSGSSDYPGVVIGLSGQDWKLNGFVDSPSSSADYEDDVLNAAGKTFSNYEDDNYFYTDGEWAFFKCYRGLASSDSSLNPRVELRELGSGDDNYTWDGNSGTHTMEYKVRVDQLPKSTSGTDGVVCFGQIHGPGDTTDDVLRVQFRGDPNQSSGDVDLKISGYLTEKQGGSQSFSGYKLDTEYTVKIQYKSKYVTVWMNGNEVIHKLMDISSKGWDWKGNYFKVGNYLQSVKGGSFDGSYGIVRIKDLSVN